MKSNVAAIFEDKNQVAGAQVIEALGNMDAGVPLSTHMRRPDEACRSIPGWCAARDEKPSDGEGFDHIIRAVENISVEIENYFGVDRSYTKKLIKEILLYKERADRVAQSERL